jgi:RimJ/RimL family protein N-acetyltransferase
MTCENRRTRPAGAIHDEPIIVPSETVNGLGGWRPASFAGTAPRAARGAVGASGPDASSLGTPAYAFLTSERLSASSADTSPAHGCKEGLAGLFSSKPQARAFVPDRKVAQPLTPRFETERLVLRVLGVEDFDDYFAVAGDPETFRYSHRGGMSSDEAWTRLLRQVGHWHLLGWGLFAVEEKATGRFVGEVGLGDFRRGLGADFDGVPEAGCTIARWAQGSGYATEAMEGALCWIERKLAPPRTVCLVHHQNRASIRVAEKLGYRSFAQRTYRGFDAILFERLRASA